MRVGIVAFEEALYTQTLRGVFTTIRYFTKNLQDVGMDTDMIICSKGKVDYPKEYTIARHCKSLDDLKDLKSTYDFIIYFTPGKSWEKYDEKDPERYTDVLDAVGLPFTFVYHSEEYKAHQPYRQNFLKHKDCRFLTFIAEFKDFYPEDLEIVPEYLIVNASPTLNSWEYIKSRAMNKDNSVIMTSSWTNFKRNLEYFELTSRFNELGITPYSAGAPSSNFYMNDILDYIVSKIDIVFSPNEMSDVNTVSKYRDYQRMMSRIGQDAPYEFKRGKESDIPLALGAYIYDKNGNSWYDYGAYYPSQIPDILSNRKFHWNMSCYKLKNKQYAPRLETVTVEAFNEGCIPVLCKETTQGWIEDGSAFRFSKYDYADHVEELANVSQEESISRLKKFYDLVQENLFEGMYGKLRDRILEEG